MKIKNILGLIEEDPAAVIDRLLASDMPYWEGVWDDVIRPVFGKKTNYGDRLRKNEKFVTVEDIFTYLYFTMAVDGKLRTLHDPASLAGFLVKSAKNYVDSLFPRRRETPDGSEVKRRGKNKIRLEFPGQDEETKQDKIEDAEQEEPDLPDDFTLRRRERVRACFNALWESNPRRAITLLLRTKGLSSRSIRQFLRLSSENYVNQVVSVAKGEYRKIALSLDSCLNAEDGAQGGL